jgi:hypothetical protein
VHQHLGFQREGLVCFDALLRTIWLASKKGLLKKLEKHKQSEKNPRLEAV